MRSKERLMGVAMGLVLTLVGMSGFTLFFSDESLLGSIQILYIENKLGSLISIGALLNLPVFFVFINQYRYDRAYGLVFFSLFLVALIAILKFI
ncbi:hypothetical protein N9M11_02390 [Flavobacteriaceae bacterium]|uniref:hypothetical protein n=1 Tax=Candidatus Arcticimaribacter forsetii TaxID=2820661 RepID=UPI0020777244|nr:hypothetical protein [Candidatus Arcticimaribacter forsetii]MDA8698951.1 hypothetical protein [Flavobacteriaceae bacterium]MDB2328945.1 hypothetical protein [Flavobacteriaceae bacterium]MDB2345244.1 hypothetical protein [Flavobacteriaceae bacterium]MDB2456251.1 hypothetical protein [Flavobacteriaceae bacterium]MDB4609215.1 hypothetical protein [Flavobacteriaceae bacterium]